MSTIAHPRSVPSGPSGKTVAGVLVGAVLAVAVGYGVVTVGEPQSVGSGADQVMTQKAALTRTERMIEINETWPLPSTSSAAGFGLDGASHALPEYIRDELAALTQNARYDSQIEYLTEQWKGAELAATEEARRRGERMFEINSFGWEPAKLESGGPKSPLTVE